MKRIISFHLSRGRVWKCSHKHLKCQKLCAFLLLLLSCVIVSPPVLKAEEGGNQSFQSSFLFKAGKEAFQKGLHEQALEYFLNARTSGMSKPSLDYNIGVCFYRLGKYQEAEKAFRKIAEYPDMVSLAYYNLGLISLKQQDSDAAVHRFQQAKSKAKNKKIRLMADTALDRLKVKERKVTWMQFASVGLGFDDNVASLADTENVQANGGDDFFAEMLGHIRRNWGKKPGESGTQLHMNVYLLQYLEMDEYDISSFSLSLLHKESVNTLRLEGKGEYTYILLDNNSFEQIPTISVQLRYPLQATKSVARFQYRFSYLDILDDDYEYLTGLRHKFLGESFWKWSTYNALLGYVLEMNDRDDPNYSPTRHTIKATFSIRPGKLLKISLGANYRKSKYHIRNLRDRNEERLRGEFRFTLYMKKDWALSGEYQYTDNYSNHEDYNYTGNMVIFSLSRSF